MDYEFVVFFMDWEEASHRANQDQAFYDAGWYWEDADAVHGPFESEQAATDAAFRTVARREGNPLLTCFWSH